MADRRRLERRRRDEREQPRHLREDLGRRLERLVDLGARRRQLEREPARPRLLPREQPVDVHAVARLGRHAPRGGVRVREQPEPLELRQLGPHRRAREVEPGALDERLRPDGRAGGDVLLDDPRQDLPLTLGQLRVRAHGSSM